MGRQNSPGGGPAVRVDFGPPLGVLALRERNLHRVPPLASPPAAAPYQPPRRVWERPAPPRAAHKPPQPQPQQPQPAPQAAQREPPPAAAARSHTQPLPAPSPPASPPPHASPQAATAELPSLRPSLSTAPPPTPPEQQLPHNRQPSLRWAPDTDSSEDSIATAQRDPEAPQGAAPRPARRDGPDEDPAAPPSRASPGSPPQQQRRSRSRTAALAEPKRPAHARAVPEWSRYSTARGRTSTLPPGRPDASAAAAAPWSRPHRPAGPPPSASASPPREPALAPAGPSEQAAASRPSSRRPSTPGAAAPAVSAADAPPAECHSELQVWAPEAGFAAHVALHREVLAGRQARGRRAVEGQEMAARAEAAAHAARGRRQAQQRAHERLHRERRRAPAATLSPRAAAREAYLQRTASSPNRYASPAARSSSSGPSPQRRRQQQRGGDSASPASSSPARYSSPQSGDDAGSAAGDALPRAPSPPVREGVNCGCVVRAHGLSQVQLLNGQVGFAVGRHLGRVLVVFPRPFGPRALRDANLEQLRSDDGAAVAALGSLADCLAQYWGAPQQHAVEPLPAHQWAPPLGWRRDQLPPPHGDQGGGGGSPPAPVYEAWPSGVCIRAYGGEEDEAAQRESGEANRTADAGTWTEPDDRQHAEQQHPPAVEAPHVLPAAAAPAVRVLPGSPRTARAAQGACEAPQVHVVEAPPPLPPADPPAPPAQPPPPQQRERQPSPVSAAIEAPCVPPASSPARVLSAAPAPTAAPSGTAQLVHRGDSESAPAGLSVGRVVVVHGLGVMSELNGRAGVVVGRTELPGADSVAAVLTVEFETDAGRIAVCLRPQNLRPLSGEAPPPQTQPIPAPALPPPPSYIPPHTASPFPGAADVVNALLAGGAALPQLATQPPPAAQAAQVSLPPPAQPPAPDPPPPAPTPPTLEVSPIPLTPASGAAVPEVELTPVVAPYVPPTSPIPVPSPKAAPAEIEAVAFEPPPAVPASCPAPPSAPVAWAAAPQLAPPPAPPAAAPMPAEAEVCAVPEAAYSPGGPEATPLQSGERVASPTTQTTATASPSASSASPSASPSPSSSPSPSPRSSVALSPSPGVPGCVVCGRSDRPGEMRKTGFKCRECVGKPSAATNYASGAPPMDPWHSPTSTPPRSPGASLMDQSHRSIPRGPPNGCVVCGRSDRPGEMRKTGFKCHECVGKPSAATNFPSGAPPMDPWHQGAAQRSPTASSTPPRSPRSSVAPSRPSGASLPPGAHACVVCGRSDRAGEMRKTGFKCKECIGKPSAGTSYPSGAPPMDPWHSAAPSGTPKSSAQAPPRAFAPNACVVCGRSDRPGEMRKTGFKCKECVGKPSAATSYASGAPMADPWHAPAGRALPKSPMQQGHQGTGSSSPSSVDRSFASSSPGPSPRPPGSQNACVVCGRADRPGEMRKTGFKCKECIGKPSAATNHASGAPRMDPWHQVSLPSPPMTPVSAPRTLKLPPNACVVCGRTDRPGEMRKTGFKCKSCVGKPSAATNFYSGAPPADPWHAKTPTAAPAPPPPAAAPAPPSAAAQQFPVGSRVTAHGLKKRAELNGALGTVVGHQAAASGESAVQVAFDGGLGSVALRAHNLVICAIDAAAVPVADADRSPPPAEATAVPAEADAVAVVPNAPPAQAAAPSAPPGPEPPPAQEGGPTETLLRVEPLQGDPPPGYRLATCAEAQAQLTRLRPKVRAAAGGHCVCLLADGVVEGQGLMMQVRPGGAATQRQPSHRVVAKVVPASPTAKPAPAPAPTAARATVQERFPVGCTVEVHGLVKRAALNGTRGQVLGYQAAPDGAVSLVQLRLPPPTGSVALREVNVRLVAPAPAPAPAPAAAPAPPAVAVPEAPSPRSAGSAESPMAASGAWDDDKSAPECVSCWVAFTAKTRRHHCRACGKIFCSTCCSKQAKVEGYSGPQRVCRDCADPPPPPLPPVAGSAAGSQQPLLVRLTRCERVPRMDYLDESDVYVRARAVDPSGAFVGSEVEWPVVWNSAEPTWNTVRDLGCRIADAQELQLRVWDKDTTAADDFIGSVRLPMNSCRLDHELAVPMRCVVSGNPRAVLCLISQPPPVKHVYLVRHGQSRWNAAKAAGRRGVMDMMKETDHPLSAAGRQQAEALRAAVEHAIAQGSDITRTTRVLASPLTRAVQTAIIGMGPVITRTRRPLWLTRWAREKRNVGGRDTTGVAYGADIVKRIRTQTERLYAGSPQEAARLMECGIDVSEVPMKWWDESAEAKDAFRARIAELTGVMRYLPDEALVIVGHSHCFRSLVSALCHPQAELIGLSHQELRERKLCNCGVMRVTLDFSKGDQPLVRAELVFSATMVGKMKAVQGDDDAESLPSDDDGDDGAPEEAVPQAAAS
eukprot:TRINITY_DN2717_c0_g1_i9.p1 TRINITY_DN2717_c0_g1~~TRINITY_DN2717_c0_g1_i9.p1  ORF type:complete len:2514 (+),score=494.95 TRINITY_DN2717_c0_g1_i9:447-7544(+)